MKNTPSRQISVLVVDDEPSVQRFVERVLSEAGYSTKVAGDGPEALEVASRMDEFDLVVTDVMMPQMTGDELARRLRVQHPTVKVLYLTGFSDRLFKEKVDAVGGRGLSRQAVHGEGTARGRIAAAVREFRGTAERRVVNPA